MIQFVQNWNVFYIDSLSNAKGKGGVMPKLPAVCLKRVFMRRNIVANIKERARTEASVLLLVLGQDHLHRLPQHGLIELVNTVLDKL